MDGPNSDNYEIGKIHKRKRYVLEDDNILNMQELVNLRLNVASEFNSGANLEESRWFYDRSEKVESTKVKTGDSIMIPVDLPDNGESIDERWANSSNWYLCTVQEVNMDLTFEVKVFGTIIDVEEQLLLPIGSSIPVALPASVILAKGKLKDMSDRLTLAWNESQSSNTKGEAVGKIKEIKNISMYGIPDLDRVPRQCSLKTEVIKRMIKVGGLIRLLGDRFERLVKDLLYCRDTFTATCQRYAETSENLPKDSIFKSLVKLPKLKGLPIYDNVDTMEKLMLGEYPLYDRSQISLKDFVSFRSESVKWGKSPTREGRAAFVNAFTNFEKVIVVYFGNDYISCCTRVLEVLNDDDDILQEFNDSFIQVKLEMVISLFFHDIYRERTSLSYPTMPMSSPSQCAALLKRYFKDEMDKAKGVASTNKWEFHPHSKFYSQEGTFNKVQFNIRPTTSLGDKRKIPDVEAQSGLCIYHLGNQMDVVGYNSQAIECRNGAKCTNRHMDKKELTKTQAYAAINSMPDGRLRKSYELKMKSCTGFQSVPKTK